MAQDIKFQQYAAPGPVGAAYIECTHPISVIMGPAGSGKTVASAYKGPYLASRFLPVCKDGVIRAKVVALRPTYRDMARTALESWHNDRLFPEKHPWTVEYTGGIDRPVLHKLKWHTMRDRTLVPVEFTMMFAAIGDANPEQFAKGFEVTACWLNECDLFAGRIPGLMFSRTGRYPAVDQISPVELDRVMRPYSSVLRKAGLNFEDGDVVLPRMVWGDCNPPDPSNWVNTMLVEEPDKWPLYKLFRQPSGLAPDAENRAGKPRSAYEQDRKTMTPADARRFVYGEIGYALDGKPVYEDDFATARHVADEVLDPLPDVPISIGMDAGGSPAAVIGQFLATGQLRVTDELCADPGTGPARFAMMLQELLLDRYRGIPIREAFIDPAAFMGRDTKTGTGAWVDFFQQAFNLYLRPTGSNEPHLRIEAVRWYLSLNIDGRTPGLILSRGTKKINGGFAAHYKLTKRNTEGRTSAIQVADNEYTHPHDALQYLCLGHRGPQTVIKEAAHLNRGPNVVPLVRPNSGSGKGWDFNIP